MRALASRLLGHLAALIPPALVLLLLGVQVAFGLRGFDRPDGGLLYVLQVPGILLGWGGVALLVPLLTWMIMDWWGYDLGGFALKGLGSGVLGVAIAGLVAINGGSSDGGIVGAGLSDVLVRSLGTTFAVALLFIMVGPAGVLALSMQRTASRPAPRAEAASEQGEEKPKRSWRLRLPSLPFLRRTSREVPKVEKHAWYPQRRYDAEGNEVPPEFGNPQGIGGIRFADEEEPTAEGAPEDEPNAAPAPEIAAAAHADVLEDEERLPTIPELLSGEYDRSRLGLTPDDPSGGAVDERAAALPPEDDGPIHVDSEGRPLPPPEPVRPPEPQPAFVAPEPEPEIEPDPEPDPVEQQPALPFVQLAAAAEGVEPPLMPGVRYADEVEEPQSAEEQEEDAELVGAAANGRATAEASMPLSAAIEQAVRGPARVEVQTDHPPAGRIESLKQTLVESFQQSGNSDRYLAKLEAIGMFDAVDAVPAAQAPARPAAARPARKARLPKKRAAAKKKARRKASARKTPPRKTPVRKKAAARKAPARKKAARKAPARKKAAGRKKAVARKKAARKPAAKKRAAKKSRATRKPKRRR